MVPHPRAAVGCDACRPCAIVSVMAGETARIGIVAGELVSGWQRDAIEALRAGGATVAARFAPLADGVPADLPGPAARLAGAAAAAFAPLPWDAPPLAPAQRARELDAVLALVEPAAAAALERARWGLWELVLPGAPPAFAALEAGAPVAEVRVERRGAQRTVVARGTVAVDRSSYGGTLRRVLALAAALPADAVRRSRAAVADGAPAPPQPAPERVGPGRAARLAARCALHRAGAALTRRVVHARWRVGVLRTAPAALLSGAPADIGWLDLPRGRFWADPFPFVTEGRTELLCEGYDYGRERGFLARCALDGERVAGPPRALAEVEHHLSYPYVVADGARRYVVPEQSQARRVALYELGDDGLRETCVLLEGIAAVDPTVIQHGGRWWLFCTDGERDDNGALLLFHAPELRGPWRPHPLNPVVRDVRGARPAGTPFVVDGALYRPAQDCSTGYGARVALARIDRLDLDGYRETVVAHLAPAPRGPGRHGLHTLALRDGVCLVDGKDLVLDPAATWAMLRADLRRLLRAVPSPLQHTEVPLRS